MKKIRRYDLDWLRVMVFGLLIFYHVGMFFVPWGWHIKNNVIYDIRIPMLFVNQWRLPILFVISGMGTAFALSHRSAGSFILERYMRLGIPLLVGMVLIVPPQVYFEWLDNGSFAGSYWAFISGPAFTTPPYPIGAISWHHLWFLPYLFVYSLLLTPVFIYLRNHPNAGLLRGLRKMLATRPASLLFFIIPLFLLESLMEPFFEITHNLVNDWFNFTSSMVLFFYGFLLISMKEEFWRAIERTRYLALGLGIICFSGQLVIWFFYEDSFTIHFIEAALKVVNFWAWILVIFWLASKYLNQNSPVLAYCNQAVYPFYILHQTLTIGIGYYLMNLGWGFWPKFLIMVIGTFLGSWVIYVFLIRPIRILHPLFGLKKLTPDDKSEPPALEPAPGPGSSA